MPCVKSLLLLQSCDLRFKGIFSIIIQVFSHPLILGYHFLSSYPAIHSTQQLCRHHSLCEPYIARAVDKKPLLKDAASLRLVRHTCETDVTSPWKFPYCVIPSLYSLGISFKTPALLCKNPAFSARLATKVGFKEEASFMQSMYSNRLLIMQNESACYGTHSV